MKFLAGFVLILLGSPSWALAGTKEEIIRLQSDVLQLQNQVRLLQKSIDDNGSVLKSLLEQLNDQVAKSNVAMEHVAQAVQAQKVDLGASLVQLRQEVQNLGVKWDDTNNRIASLHQKLEEQQVRMSQVQDLRSAGGAIEPDQVYNAALNDFLMGNYDLAIEGFQDFLTNFRDTELSDNALYYIGVAYQTQGRVDQAIQAYEQLINLYPKADKLAAAHYKRATALQQLQKNADAIDAFRKIVQLFPDTQEATMANQELEKMGAAPTESPRRKSP